MPLRLTGLSKPSETAWAASLVSDAASGLRVKVIYLNDAATTPGVRALPV